MASTTNFAWPKPAGTDGVDVVRDIGALADAADTTVGTFTAAWSTWTPVWTNLTVGSGTVTARYLQIGKTVNWRIKFTYGTGSVVGSNPTFTLPVTAHASFATDDLFGLSQALDAGLQVFAPGLYYSGSSNAYFKVGATSPFTFGTGDSLQAYGTYEAA